MFHRSLLNQHKNLSSIRHQEHSRQQLLSLSLSLRRGCLQGRIMARRQTSPSTCVFARCSSPSRPVTPVNDTSPVRLTAMVHGRQPELTESHPTPPQEPNKEQQVAYISSPLFRSAPQNSSPTPQFYRPLARSRAVAELPDKNTPSSFPWFWALIIIPVSTYTTKLNKYGGDKGSPWLTTFGASEVRACWYL